MAVTALQTAATGMSALSQQIDIIANNLANVNTTGFKSFRANLEDLTYQQKAQPGVVSSNAQTPSGLYVGLGTRISNTQPDFTQGAPVSTGGQLDWMVNGQGFFKVKLLQQLNDGVGYTRAGNFSLNANREIVLGNAQGLRLEPPMVIPDGTTQISVSADGVVNAYVNSSPTPTQVGTLQLANFVNPSGLCPQGGNVFTETPASGPPIDGQPGIGSFGTIQQQYLEASNVDSVSELVNLIKTQRAFEMNSQAIQTANQMMQVVSNLRNG
jgi:flagellar basal-body rod protein FlgG